jgi:hypothetical protein
MRKTYERELAAVPALLIEWVKAPPPPKDDLLALECRKLANEALGSILALNQFRAIPDPNPKLVAVIAKEEAALGATLERILKIYQAKLTECGAEVASESRKV